MGQKVQDITGQAFSPKRRAILRWRVSAEPKDPLLPTVAISPMETSHFEMESQSFAIRRMPAICTSLSRSSLQ